MPSSAPADRDDRPGAGVRRRAAVRAQAVAATAPAATTQLYEDLKPAYEAGIAPTG